MAKVNIDKSSPDFTLEEFNGRVLTLSELKGKSNVLLVFNRGFT